MGPSTIARRNRTTSPYDSIACSVDSNVGI
jgi:hypothetical protein